MPITIPARLVRQYQAGVLRSVDLAERLGVSVSAVRAALRRQEAILCAADAMRAAFARRVERKNRLPAGTLYRHVVVLYRQGKGLTAIAEQLGLSKRMGELILDRAGVDTRPVYFRSALFVDGVWQDKEAFARALRRARTASGLSQKKLGVQAGLTQGAVWLLEHAKNGPHWRTALKLADALGVSPQDLGLPDVPIRTARRLARGRPSSRRR
jgi:DNA-binding XRE family transcriptional regulator